MYSELAWVLVSLGTHVQLQIIMNLDYLPGYLSVSYDYGKNEAINLMQNAQLTEKSRTLENIKIYYRIYKWVNKFKTFGDIEIVKNKFYFRKNPIFLKDVDIEKVLVSNKISFVEKNYKYFIGCLYNDHKINPLHEMYPKTSAYVKSYDAQTKWMYFMIKDDDLLERCNTIWNKVSADIKKEFDSETL